MRGRTGMRVLLGAGTVVTLIGAVTLIVALSAPQTASFGWFAYAPLSGATFTPDGVNVISTSTLIGLALVALGLVALAFWAGHATARHHHPRAER